MLKLGLLSALFCLVTGSPTGTLPKLGFQEKIVGGQEAEPHSYPWQISLQYHDILILPTYHTCGATIIDEYHVACAAHCIHGRKANHFKVLAGAHDIGKTESTTQLKKVVDMWEHESYNSREFSNDVSLLRLDEPLEFNEYVQPLKLAELGSDPEAGTICINSGWGSTSHTNTPHMPDKLQYVELPIVGRETCQANYNSINEVDSGMVCAGQAEGGISPCSGDSGGPLICPNAEGEWYLAGIVSWGMIPCGQPNYPGVFANVGHFRDWFDEHLKL